MVNDSTRDAALALHRFGLGPRPGTIAAIASDPRGALLAELERPGIGRIDNAIAANYLRQEWIVLNPTVQSDLRFLRNNLNGVDFLVDSQSNDNDRWVVTAYGPKHPLSYFLFDRGGRY
jgi:hypothetical protein